MIITMMFLKSPRFASNKKTNEKSRVIEIQKKLQTPVQNVDKKRHVTG